MDQPLGVRLGAEALGTFLFFFLGFSGIAVVVDIGVGRDHAARRRRGLRIRPRARHHRVRAPLRRPLQPGRQRGPRDRRQVPTLAT